MRVLAGVRAGPLDLRPRIRGSPPLADLAGRIEAWLFQIGSEERRAPHMRSVRLEDGAERGIREDDGRT
jgi:hypothetical protein